MVYRVEIHVTGPSPLGIEEARAVLAALGSAGVLAALPAVRTDIAGGAKFATSLEIVDGSPEPGPGPAEPPPAPPLFHIQV